LNQLSGFNSVIFYSNDIFYVIPYIDATTATVFVGLVNFTAVALSCFILARWGRRAILKVLTFIIAAILFGLAGAYFGAMPFLEVTLVLAFMVLYQFSLGSITWIYVAEICEEKAVSLSIFTMGVVTVLIAFFTEVLLKDIGGWLFIIFGLFMILTGFFAIYHLKETKGLSNEEMAVLYVKKEHDGLKEKRDED